MPCKCAECKRSHPVSLIPEDQREPRIYRIIRFYRNGRTARRTIKSNVTLTDAQAHCSREDTHKAGVWFDGYDYMRGCAPKGERFSATTSKHINKWLDGVEAKTVPQEEIERLVQEGK